MNWEPLTVAQLDAVLAQEDALLLDMRDSDSFRRGHIPGAIRVDDGIIRTLVRERARARPLVVCCYRGNSSRELCGLLAEFGLHPVYNLEGGWEAWSAAQAPHGATHGLADWLTANGFDPGNPNSRIGNGTAPLMLAAQRGERERVEWLLAAGADVNALNDDMNGALWFACVGSHVDLVGRLAAAGADIDNQNVNGATCLIYAASSGKLEVLRALVEAGADTARCTLDGFTALDSASTLPVLRYLKPLFTPVT